MQAFNETSCSQCGVELGPGDAGVSHCSDHAKAYKVVPAHTIRDQRLVQRDYRAALELAKKCGRHVNDMLVIAQMSRTIHHLCAEVARFGTTRDPNTLYVEVEVAGICFDVGFIFADVLQTVVLEAHVNGTDVLSVLSNDIVLAIEHFVQTAAEKDVAADRALLADDFQRDQAEAGA